MRVDEDGEFWIDTILDIISLGGSIANVVIAPTDLRAWAGLAGDVIDVIRRWIYTQA